MKLRRTGEFTRDRSKLLVQLFIRAPMCDVTYDGDRLVQISDSLIPPYLYVLAIYIFVVMVNGRWAKI